MGPAPFPCAGPLLRDAAPRDVGRAHRCRRLAHGDAEKRRPVYHTVGFNRLAAPSAQRNVTWCTSARRSARGQRREKPGGVPLSPLARRETPACVPASAGSRLDNAEKSRPVYRCCRLHDGKICPVYHPGHVGAEKSRRLYQGHAGGRYRPLHFSAYRRTRWYTGRHFSARPKIGADGLVRQAAFLGAGPRELAHRPTFLGAMVCRLVHRPAFLGIRRRTFCVHAHLPRDATLVPGVPLTFVS